MSLCEEEWQKRFPVLEMTMNEHALSLTLASDKAALSVRVPQEMVNSWFDWWQKLQNGTSTEKELIGRWYTGEWPKEDSVNGSTQIQGA